MDNVFLLCLCRANIDEVETDVVEIEAKLDKVWIKSIWNNFRCEKEMEEQISEDTWHESIQTIYTSSVSLRYKDIHFRITKVHHLLWCKDRLGKIRSYLEPTW